MSDPVPTTPDKALLDWFAKHPQCELSFAGYDDEQHWVVHRVSGGRNDREWRLVGEGETPRAAILAAMEGMRHAR